MLQEFLRIEADSAGNAISRIGYLTFNNVEGHWNYVLMNPGAGRDHVARNFERGAPDRIDPTFQPIAIAGAGLEVSGQLLRMTQTITLRGPDRDMRERYFMLANATGTNWLAHHYECVRRT